ncbi:short-chain fatty acid transporter [Allosediminivita pacifica]|uniref:Short-chain fatty acids transporter n=1 Tax=Allosediminivita pacifica TaxID=1267769 RepID=A0A2T6AB39_9RHOB|nr:short-chain fatty acid transporter [Allosediminivita pacifica]PTX41031.1 short-chain fatty acids transporter [Allosediminivita pacifica]GGB26148.1 short-chain fatty acids transporter [Allosediminivita pacifica]
MLNAVSRPLVRLFERWLPDPYIFVVILTLIVMIAAMAIEGQTPLAVVEMWGSGFWGLLAFSMQMLLVLVTGFMMASTPLVKSGLQKLAGLASSPAAAIMLVSYVGLAASWLNWGFGLVVGALFAKEVARKVKVDYRLLVASAYSGFIVWHGGLAGSVPLAVATEGHPFQDMIGIIGTGETIFSGFNLAIVLCLFVAVPLLNRAMLPTPDESVYVDPKQLEEAEPPVAKGDTPAERMEGSRILTWLIGLSGLAFLFDYFVSGGALTLNIVNFLFLFVAILLHGTPRNLLASLNEGIKGGAGIVIQFPFYAGIMAIMVDSGLAGSISSGMVSFASETSLPFWSFLSAGVVNFFVPSGGGQWAVQAPVILPAAAELGVDPARAAMSVAWGDAWTNMIQPFWALPILGIAGLKAKDIMGFCTLHLVVSGVIISLGLTFL